MNLPKDGTKPLDKDGFDLIALNVFFSMAERYKFVPLLSFWDILSIYSKAVCGKFEFILACVASSGWC